MSSDDDCHCTCFKSHHKEGSYHFQSSQGRFIPFQSSQGRSTSLPIVKGRFLPLPINHHKEGLTPFLVPSSLTFPSLSNAMLEWLDHKGKQRLPFEVIQTGALEENRRSLKIEEIQLGNTLKFLNSIIGFLVPFKREREDWMVIGFPTHI